MTKKSAYKQFLDDNCLLSEDNREDERVPRRKKGQDYLILRHYGEHGDITAEWGDKDVLRTAIQECLKQDGIYGTLHLNVFSIEEDKEVNWREFVQINL